METSEKIQTMVNRRYMFIGCLVTALIGAFADSYFQIDWIKPVNLMVAGGIGSAGIAYCTMKLKHLRGQN